MKVRLEEEKKTIAAAVLEIGECFTLNGAPRVFMRAYAEQWVSSSTITYVCLNSGTVGRLKNLTQVSRIAMVAVVDRGQKKK